MSQQDNGPHAQGRDATSLGSGEMNDLWTAPGADDFTFGSTLDELLRRGGYRQVTTLDPGSKHRIYTECQFCGGCDSDRKYGQRSSSALVKHDSKCSFAKHLPRLRAMATRDVT